MNDIYFYKHDLTYEDCGVLGGRTIYGAGRKMEVQMGDTRQDFLGKLVVDAQEHFRSPKFFYPFERVAVCAILQNGTICYAMADAYSAGCGSYLYREEPATEEGVDYEGIGAFISAHSIQRYDILLQKEENLFEIMNYKTPEKERLRGFTSYDVFRCLDLQGACKTEIAERNELYHNYVRYNLESGFYVEAYDNEEEDSREFWLCRSYAFSKHLITSFDHGDTDYLGLFNDQDNLIVDQQVATLLCKLAEPKEFIFIDNAYCLSSVLLPDNPMWKNK